MGKLFGTDGIRGVANQYPMTPEMALNVGRAVAGCLSADNDAKILIGRDTRISGSMIESALISGICSIGSDVLLAGIMPTPGIAHLTTLLQASAGLVVSASHNPYFDNGIKVFNAEGFKLSDEKELEVEEAVLSEALARRSRSIKNTGSVHRIPKAEKSYTEFLRRTLPPEIDFKGVKIVIDCSNGATYRIAPDLFNTLGAWVEALFVEPDGKNINENCGSQHPQVLAHKVKAKEADIGLAFDGDGDRLIAVDENGTILTGDQILAICADYLKRKGALTNNTVVSTVMSNMGLNVAFNERSIKHIITGVGDRHVVTKMLAGGAVLGGEESGHTVFLNHQTTGDGMLTALKLIEVMITENKPLSELKTIMTVFPQVLINVEVKSKPELKMLPEITAVIETVEKNLSGKGRVLVRYSGTQPQCRVMVEGSTEGETRRFCQEIADVIKDKIGVQHNKESENR